MKKLSILLALIMALAFPSAVLAEKQSDSDKHYKVVESHKQITDKMN